MMTRLLLINLLFVSNLAWAQIDITFPQSRAVFQRNNANYATLQIAGNYSQNINRIEARLVPLQGGTAIDWTTIQNDPNFGSYQGSLLVYGGWYRLEVRGLFNNGVVGTASVDKVGIGEVFVIAGQSNAQGYDGFGNVSAADDRVNCITNYYSTGETADPPYPQISQLSSSVKIAPFGNGSWCWGKLGDLLSQRLNVPILFINAAWEAMSSEQWKRSSDGLPGYNHYSGNYAPAGYPYGNLKKSLQYYASLLGMRGILWHQGEADNDDKISTQDYKNNLTYIINKTRGDTGKNITWAVARVSRTQYSTYQPVIDAQNQVIQQVNNVFPGPSTDDIGDRVDGLHFYGNGLISLAQAWNNSLDGNYFNNSTPYTATPMLAIQTFCNSSNTNAPVRLSMPPGYSSYNWNTGSGSDAINVNAGSFSGKAKDNFGNTSFLPEIHLTAEIIPTTPTVTPNGSTNFCQGKNVVFTTNYNFRNYWSNGVVDNAITVTTPGDYSVTHVSLYGCVASSPSVNVKVSPGPTANVTVDGATTFCSDKSVKLTSNVQTGNTWSNGANSPSIVVNKTGNYTLTVTNNEGCSTTTQPVVVTVSPDAPLPAIAADGVTTFCADKSVKIFTNLSNNIVWSNGATTPTINVNQSGDYSVTSSNEFGCKSVSSVISVKVNPLPEKPIVTTDGPITFCADKAVTLTSSVATNITWTTGATDKSIRINNSGNYSVTSKNQFGCTQTSSLVTIKVNPLPAQPLIAVGGPTTFCADQSVTLTSTPNISYIWSQNGTTQSITVKESGLYSVKVADQNGCISPASKSISVIAKALPAVPTIIQSGTYTLEGTSSGFAVGQYYEWQLDNSKIAFTTPKIKAKVSGNYTIKGIIDYTLDDGSKLTCFSNLSAPYSFLLDPNNNGMSVYPNPSPLGYVNIETFDDLENADVIFYSMKGFQVESFRVDKFDERKTFNVRDIPKGMYLLQVKNPNFNVTKRIFLE